MNHPHTPWESLFRQIHSRAVEAWHSGKRSPTSMFSPEDEQFLASIGCSAQEMFDFVDDLCYANEPDLETVLAIQAIRKDYLAKEMRGIPSTSIASMDSLPPKSQAVDGIPWLPRLIVKARLKLRGEMPADLMYGCGGDRPFVARMRTTLHDFLSLVRDCGEDDRKIINAVKRSAGIS
jgi:hypothetical protein